MNYDQILDYAHQLIAGEITVEKIPSGKEYILIQNIMRQRNNMDIFHAMSEESRKRLSRKGYTYYGNLGWWKPNELQDASIENKYGEWVITVGDKYRKYLQLKWEIEKAKREKNRNNFREEQESLLTLDDWELPTHSEI